MASKGKNKRTTYTPFQTQTLWTYSEAGMNTMSKAKMQQCADEIGLTPGQVKQWINNHVVHVQRNNQDKPVGLNINTFHAFCIEYKERVKFSGSDWPAYNAERLEEYNRVKNDPVVIARLTAYCEKRKNMNPEDMSDEEKKGIVQALFGVLDKTCKQLANFEVQTACTSFIKGSVPSVHSSPALFNFIMRNEFSFLERTQKFLYGPTEDIRNMKRDVLLSVVRTKFNSLWHKAKGYRTSGPPPYAAMRLGDPIVCIIGLGKELKMQQPKDYDKENFNLLLDHLDEIEIEINGRMPEGSSPDDSVQVINGDSQSAAELLYHMENGPGESPISQEEELSQVMEFEVPIDALHSGSVTLDTTATVYEESPDFEMGNSEEEIPVTLDATGVAAGHNVEKGKKSGGNRTSKRNASRRILRSTNTNSEEEEEELPSKVPRVRHPMDKENKPKKGVNGKNGRGSGRQKKTK